MVATRTARIQLNLTVEVYVMIQAPLMACLDSTDEETRFAFIVQAMKDQLKAEQILEACHSLTLDDIIEMNNSSAGIRVSPVGPCNDEDCDEKGSIDGALLSDDFLLYDIMRL